eukprot:5274312-Prymnesium_polylepis.1
MWRMSHPAARCWSSPVDLPASRASGTSVRAPARLRARVVGLPLERVLECYRQFSVVGRVEGARGAPAHESQS